MHSPPLEIRKSWVTDDELFQFECSFEYSRVPPLVTVAITSTEAPMSPPGPSIYALRKGQKTRIAIDTADGGRASGEMHIVAIPSSSLADNADNAGIWLDFYYGFQGRHHFEGVTVTFQTNPSHG